MDLPRPTRAVFPLVTLGRWAVLAGPTRPTLARATPLLTTARPVGLADLERRILPATLREDLVRQEHRRPAVLPPGRRVRLPRAARGAKLR
ncbi:hypothetical protein GCM10027360_49130 [Amycolatopsis echigonensis]